MLPAPMFWWLESYSEFRQHLEHYYPLLLRQDNDCMIYSLVERAAIQTSTVWSRVEEVLTHFEHLCNRQPAILDWNTGLKIATRFPRHVVFEPPPGNQLPYLDRTVDLVAVNSPDALMLSEAHRVADSGVMLFSNCRGTQDVSVTLKIAGPITGPKCLPRVVIVIPVILGRIPTARWIGELRGSLPLDFLGEILVVHALSGNIDAELRLMADMAGVTIRHYPNASALALLNIAASGSDGDILIFLDSETVPLPGWLPPIIQTFHDHTDAGAVAAKILMSDGRLHEAGCEMLADGLTVMNGNGQFDCEAPEHNFVCEVNCCSSSMIATRRSCFLEAGGFGTEFDEGDSAYADYCHQLRGRGLRVYYQPQARLVGLPKMTRDARESQRDRQEDPFFVNK